MPWTDSYDNQEGRRELVRPGILAYHHLSTHCHLIQTTRVNVQSLDILKSSETTCHQYASHTVIQCHENWNKPDPRRMVFCYLMIYVLPFMACNWEETYLQKSQARSTARCRPSEARPKWI